ncbi:MAG: sensor histidine kinase [Gammaproteobacteria bacterium]
MVASFTQLLKKKYGDQLDETAQEYIQFAFDGAQRMQQLISDLLSYSRLGRQALEESPVDVAALMVRVMQALQLAIDESGARADCRELPVVRDNGIGIDMEQSGRVFEIFQRLHSRSEYPGTGIGLSVCKRIVERHGGRIWFETAPGGGSVFCFTLVADRYAAPGVVDVES